VGKNYPITVILSRFAYPNPKQAWTEVENFNTENQLRSGSLDTSWQTSVATNLAFRFDLAEAAFTRGFRPNPCGSVSMS
jgi:hypothetical protein